MKSNQSFVRKVIYLGCIAALLFPLYQLSAPAVSTVDPVTGEVTTRGGGYLAAERRKHKLAQAELGDVDPAGATMKLATLGLRGVAVNLLWDRANEYKKTERWDDFIATLHQIKRLQPHFLTVWEFQAHNVSYNTSVEFDDYRLRYHWVKRGIDFLMDGVRYNRDDPKLLDYMGWVFGHKFGRSDEVRQFRRMFRDDTDWHAELGKHVDMAKCAGPDRRRPDNWKVGYEWYMKAVEAVETKGKQERGSPLIFYSHPAMSLINYADAIEEDGHLDEIAREAWRQADREWWRELPGGRKSFGERQISSSFGYKIRLNDKERTDAEAQKQWQELDALSPGVRQRLEQAKVVDLPPDQREAYETPAEKRRAEQTLLADIAARQLKVEARQVAEQASPELRGQARRIAHQIGETEHRANTIERYREVVNFVYWRTRCTVEQTVTATDAHKFVFQAVEAKNRGHLVASTTGEKQPGAKELFEKAFELYGQIYRQHPELVGDPRYDDVLKQVEMYRAVLGDLDEKFPENFPLQELLDKHKGSTGTPTAGKPAPPKKEAEKVEGQKPASPPEAAKPETNKPEPSPPEANKPEVSQPPEKSAPSEPPAPPETPAAAPPE